MYYYSCYIIIYGNNIIKYYYVTLLSFTLHFAFQYFKTSSEVASIINGRQWYYLHYNIYIT